MTRKYIKYTDEETGTILALSKAGKTYNEIAEVVNSLYDTQRTSQSIQQKLVSLVKQELETTWQNEPATRKQINKIARLLAKGEAEREIIKVELKKSNLTKGQADEQIKGLLMQVEVSQNTPKVKKERKSPQGFTKIEDAKIMKLRSERDSYATIGKKLGRSARSIQNRYYRIRDSYVEPSILEEEIEETPLIEINQEETKETFYEESHETSWTHSQDMNILVNFYEMSIDEVREAFARPYWVVAQRLEMLFDSSEPEHIAMLMEASTIILKRKSPRIEKPQKPSRKERRMAKRAEKKAAKVARLEAKMKRKLKQLRGE